MRYALFGNTENVIKGGWYDLLGMFDDIQGIWRSIDSSKLHWWHIVDLEEKRITSGGNNPSGSD